MSLKHYTKAMKPNTKEYTIHYIILFIGNWKKEYLINGDRKLKSTCWG